MQMDVNEIVEIINNSTLDDVEIFDETYSHLLVELPEGPDRERYRILKRVVTQRKETLNGQPG